MNKSVDSEEFKLEKDVVQRREALLREGGINFVLNCAIGTDMSFEDLRQKHDAVLVATGVYKARTLDFGDSKAAPAADADHKGVVPALHFLK